MGAAQAAALKKSRVVKQGGRPQAAMALVLDGLFYRLRNCGPWRDLPPQFGPWETLYGWHRKLARAGVW
ncbi:transposase, partial [Prosthecobacter sp.]|uniref:transposase n=1 Tax=Prosthecobacter sp. TaxID=1965333 RepID=UPI003BAEE43C